MLTVSVGLHHRKANIISPVANDYWRYDSFRNNHLKHVLSAGIQDGSQCCCACFHLINALVIARLNNQWLTCSSVGCMKLFFSIDLACFRDRSDQTCVTTPAP